MLQEKSIAGVMKRDETHKRQLKEFDSAVKGEREINRMIFTYPSHQTF